MSLKQKNITSLLQSFPSMPGAAVKLLSLMDDPDINVVQIETILGQDPGLMANILRLANSAYFGMPSKVGSIKQAVLLLGLRRLMQIVIASCVSAIMDKPVSGYDLPPGELWHHSIGVSVAAEGLIQELNLKVDEEIFTAALLHDVGKLVVGEFLDKDIKKIESSLSEGLSFEKAENIVLGTNHADVGAQILKQWSLPSVIVNAVRWHHSPESADNADVMLDIIHVANVLCLMIGVGVGRDGLQYQPSEAVVERLKLEPYHLERVASHVLQWVNELSDVLGGDG
jgi:putative nucleotidyltransferase with HDIG domain